MPLRLHLKRLLSHIKVRGERPILLDALIATANAANSARQKIVEHREKRLKKDRAAATVSHVMAISTKRPLDLNIEVTNFCAASCVFCPNSKIKRQKTSMDMALFKKIVDDYAAIGGGALGLSSMQSDLFFDRELIGRIEYLQKYRSSITLYGTTYAVGATKFSDDDLEKILRAFSYLQISLGGVDRESYHSMYGVNGFDTAKAQLLRMKSIVEKHDLPIRLDLMFRTQYASQVMDSNLVRDLGSSFSVVEVRDKFFSWGGIISQADLPEGAKLDIMYNSGKRKNCAVSNASMSIAPDGSVVGCGCVDWNSKHPVGSIIDSSIASVWSSEPAVAFREGFSRGQIPELCEECALYISTDEAFSRDGLAQYHPRDGLYYTL